MRRPTFALLPFVALAGCISYSSGTGHAPPPPPAPRYGLEVSLAVAGPDTLLATATLTDLDTGRLIAAPKMQFATGSESSVSSDDPVSGSRFRLTISAAPGKGEATWSAELTKGTTALLRHKATVRLAGDREAPPALPSATPAPR